MSRRFQFSLRWPFLFLAAMMAGGQTSRNLALREKPTLGSVILSNSAAGEATFFFIGCLAAFAGMAIVVATPAALRIRSPWRRPSDFRRMCVMLIAALIIGVVSAGAAFMTLALLFMACNFLRIYH